MSITTTGPLVYNRLSRILGDGAKQVRLTRGEGILFGELARRSPWVVTRASLWAAIYDARDQDAQVKAVDIVLCRLRRHLADSGFAVTIETTLGAGFSIPTPIAILPDKAPELKVAPHVVTPLKRLLRECTDRPSLADLAERVRQGIQWEDVPETVAPPVVETAAPAVAETIAPAAPQLPVTEAERIDQNADTPSTPSRKGMVAIPKPQVQDESIVLPVPPRLRMIREAAEQALLFGSDINMPGAVRLKLLRMSRQLDALLPRMAPNPPSSAKHLRRSYVILYGEPKPTRPLPSFAHKPRTAELLAPRAA